MPRSPSLFDAAILPEGFLLREAFLEPDEERSLVERFGGLEFHEMRMRGVAARRRVIQYGWRYSFESFKVSDGPPFPTAEAVLMPRSIYALTGAARSEWQHSIPAVGDLRYSITFRTMRAQRT